MESLNKVGDASFLPYKLHEAACFLCTNLQVNHVIDQDDLWICSTARGFFCLIPFALANIVCYEIRLCVNWLCLCKEQPLMTTQKVIALDPLMLLPHYLKKKKLWSIIRAEPQRITIGW